MAYKYAWKSHMGIGKAHLVIGDVVHRDGIPEVAACGVTVDTDAPYAERCKKCTRAIANLAVDVAQSPPTRVRETLTVTVERNATNETILAFLRRKLTSATTIELVSYELAQPEPVKEG